jgi:HD superfamily phosphohydrolase
MSRIFLCLFVSLLPTLLVGRPLDTCYGTLEVEEQVLWDLIESPAVQRLKKVRQYGVGYLTTDRELYDRYQHSIGVLALLRMNNAPLQEQIAGLLHDASHTAFSHLGDFFFQHTDHKSSYQDSIHSWHLEQSGLGAILSEHAMSIDEICHKNGTFHALESELPDLCADRLDYNLQGSYRRGWITKEQVEKMATHFKYDGTKWVCSDLSTALLVGEFSLYMTQYCWSSQANADCNQWLAEALVRACEIDIVSLDDVHFGTDEVIWNKLKASSDPEIQNRIEKILHWSDHSTVYAIPAGSKFRGVDPLVNGTRLTELSEAYRNEYQRLRKKMS